MHRAYLLLINGEDGSQDLDSADSNPALQSEGMHLRATFGGVSIFTSAETPTLQLSEGGFVVGDLYSNHGVSIRDAGQLACAPYDVAIRHHILENCWGDYILVLSGADNLSEVSVTRSPSPASDLQCFYSRNGQGFVTSDISLATRLGLYRRRVDFDYIAHRLIYPDLKTIRTSQVDISELQPGCTLYLRNGNARVTQDWSPWNFVSAEMRYADLYEAASAIRSAVELVVRTWASRNESILLELSGGLDSSIVSACLKHSQAKVTCSTLTAPVPGANERDYAELIAAMLGVELSVTELAYDDAPFDFPVPQEFITPVIGPLQYAIDKVMQATAERNGATSYFSGAGGDTVFCYLTNAAPAADAFREAGLSTGIQAIRDLSMFHQCTYWKAGRLTLRKLIRAQDQPYAIDNLLLPSRAYLPEPELHPWLSSPTNALPGDRQRVFELSATQFFRDSCPRGLNRSLRMPLLTQPVIEACLRAPSWMWFSGGQNRAIARHAFSDVLPPKILARKSKGTFTAYLGALYRRNMDKTLDFLLDGELHSHDLLDAEALHKFAEGELPRRGNSFMRIFQLCTLENWVRRQP